MAIASMAQVFVGLYNGNGDLKRIGPCVWQLIWFSFLSLLVTLPLSFWVSSFYFKGAVIEQAGSSYFRILTLGNFLFPLSTALTSFYLGRGKVAFVTTLLLASYACHLGLSWVLIFGLTELIPSLGVQGAALAKCLSMGCFCCVFFCSFLSQKNRALYATGSWRLSFSRLWSYAAPGLMRAFGYFWARISWVAISYIMIKKGGVYLDVQVIGGMVTALFMFIVVGVHRSLLTITSNLLGRKDYSEVWKLCRSLMVYVCLIGAVLAVPILLCPQSLVYFFDVSSRELYEKVFRTMNHWVWFYLVAVTLQMGLSSFVVAARDLRVQLYCALLTSVTSLFPVYLSMQFFGWSPDKLWLIIGVENVILAFVIFYRFYQRKWEVREAAIG